MKNRPIEELKFKGAVYNALKRAGINDTDTLLDLRDNELLSVPDIGVKRFAYIVDVLKAVVESEACGEVS